MSRPRKVAAILSALAAAAAMTTGAAAFSSATTAATTTTTVADCGVLFDDFHYDSINDADFQSHGWNARTEAGGPGVPGASWPAGNITFQQFGWRPGRSVAGVDRRHRGRYDAC